MIGFTLWLPGAVAVFVSRSGHRRATTTLLAGLILAGVGSALLAIAIPAVSKDSAPMNVLYDIALIGMAVLCAVATVAVLRHSEHTPTR